MSKAKMFGILILVLVGFIALSAAVSAVPVTVNGVEVNGKELTSNKTRI
jgi:hypothetical protein